MKSANRVLAIMLSVFILISTMSVFANAAAVSDFFDFPAGSWSEEAMTAAVNNDLLKGRGNGLIAPKDYITRAEAVAVINRAFGATVKADISGYTDVDEKSWYYNEIAKAVNMRTIVGVSSNRIDPEGYITRESMLTVLARALVLDEGYTTSLSRFADGGDVSSWAEPLVAAMAERGYVNGNEKGELNPQSYITREEFAQVMHNIFKTYIPDDITINYGTYGTTVIRAKDVTLNNVIIKGDLVAGDGVGAGNLNLTNVTVTGRILFRGGEGNVKLTNTTVGEKVVINDVNGIVNFLNYRAEAPFKNIQENTEATFLTMSVNKGGGGSSTPSRVEYDIKEYTQKLNGDYELRYSDEKMANYGKTITYTERNLTGFTFNPDHPDSVLSGTNKGKLVLKAYYTRNKYKVSFDGYETELPYEEKINVDPVLKNKMQDTVDKNKEDGYNTVFNTKEDGTGTTVTIDKTTVGAEDLPIYAIKTPIEYKINYNLNGGSIVGDYYKTYTVESDEINLPENVVKKGYTFGGWFDEDGNRTVVIDPGSKGNKTFTANWDIITYTITYVPGEFGTMDGVTAKAGYTVEDDKYTLPTPVVTKQDYVFKGWYTNASFVGKAVTVLNPADAENKTYYAKIVERTYEQYTIKYDGKTYTVTEGEEIGDAVDSKGNKLGDAMDNTTYPKGYEADDFRIKGDEDTIITKETVANGNMEIVAAKKAIVYTITYELDSGVLDGTQKTSYTVEDADYTLPTPTKTDYVFDGWYENGTKVTKLDTADAENKVYTATWSKVKQTVTYNGKTYTVEKGGKLGDAVDSNGNKLGGAMDNTTYPKGYEADGFHIKGNPAEKVTKDTPVNANIEIEAAKKAIVYTITYNLDGGILDGTQKTTYTVEDADYELPTPSKGSYTFLGWYENGTKVTVLDTSDAEDKTYNASWRAPAAVKYTITFKGEDYDVVRDNALYTNDALKAAMDAAETSATKGYEVTFNTKSDGTGTNVTTDTKPKGDMEIFVIETPIEYTITYEENGGSTVDDDTYTVKDADITLPVPEKTDYVFRGWYEESDFSGEAVKVLDTAEAENKTYYAKWVLDNAVLSFDHEVKGDVVTLKVMLNAIPADIDDIAAMALRYSYDNTKLEYVETVSNVGYATSASSGYISWFAVNNNYIDSDTLTANNVLFTITFNKKALAYGTTNVSYTFAELVASEPVGNPAIGTKYTKESETIDLGTQTQSYTITYVTNGGNAIPEGSYTVNDADITLPTPTRTDYAFKGWYEESDFSGEAVTVLDTADAENKTYYAKWVIETATLDFSAEVDGNNIKIYVTLDEIPSDIDDIAAFTLRYKHPENKLNYASGSTTLGGNFSSQDGYISWYTDENAITSEALKANGNILATLVYAKDDSASGTETFEYTLVEIVASEPASNPAIGTKFNTDTEEVQLDAVTYVVTFSGNTYNITAGNALSSNASLVAAMNEAANKTGYTVTFNTKADGTGETVTTATKPTGDMVFYAVENTIDYTITYELHDGVLDGTQKTSYTVEDTDYTLPTPTKNGFEFLGWYENGTKVEILNTADAEDKTYVAMWELSVYNIAYVLNGGALDGTQKESYTKEDADYTLPVPTKDGYTFLGWYENAKFTGNKVTVLDTADAEDKTYYAKWFAETATLDFKSEIDGDNVKIYLTIDNIPSDINDIAAFTLKYKHPDNQLMFVSGSTAFSGNFSASDGYVSWYNNTTAITTDELLAKDNILAVLEFTKKPSASGVETFEYTYVEIVASEPQNNPAIAENYKTDKEEVELGESTEEKYTITYMTNGGALDGTQWSTYTTSSVLPYTLPTPVKGEVPFLGWYENEECTGDPVTELVAGSTGDKTYYAKWAEYTVQFYLGTAISRNKPTSDDGDRGMMLVEHGATLTQADVDRELGMLPSEYKMQEGYTDSDGVVHEIAPELWYQKDGKWIKFVPDEIPVVSDMDIHLFTRFVALEYTTDLQIKGIDLSELDFSLSVPYDSNTYIVKTYLDILTNAGITAERVLGQVEDQGYDLYQMAIDTAASKSLVDSDKNIINPKVLVPLHRFITKERILAEIDKYIENNIGNEEFIADILRNDAVVDMLLDDDSIRIKVMEDSSMREKLITDAFIDEMLSDEELVNKIVTSEEFKKRFIYNDATIEYVLDDDALMDMIINEPEFHRILIDECVKFIIDVYFEQTKQSPALYNYIEDILHSDAFIKDIESKPELKIMLEDEIKNLVKTATGDTKDELYATIRDTSKVNLRQSIIDVIKTDAGVKAEIKVVVQNDSELKEEIKTTVKDTAKEDIKASVKEWVLNKIDTDSSVQAQFITYIKDDKATLRLVMADIDDVDGSHIDDYINGALDATATAEIDSKINTYLSDSANLKVAVEDYFDIIYLSSYDSMYNTYFDDFYTDDAIFNVAYNKFVEDDASFTKAFDSYISTDANLDTAFDSFTKNDVKFHEFYETYIGDDEQFNALFERYYKTHVHDVANKAYHDDDLHDMVQDYIWDYTEELVVEYADGSLAEKHSELVDAIDALMHDDVPIALREAYENNPTVKSKIDTLIETDAIEIIEKHLNGTLDAKTEEFLDGEISAYIDDVIDSYIDGTIDSEMKEFVDKEIDEYMEKLINDYISGADRDTLSDLIPDYAKDAVDAIKKTDAFKNTINDFVSGNGVRVNENNLMFVEIIADVIGKYDYETLVSDFLPDKVKKILDFVGKDVAEEYVNKYLDVFCTGINEALDSLNADIEAEIEGTEYRFSTSPAVRINYMEIVKGYYDKLIGKMREKVNSQSKIPVSSNPYAQRLVDMDYFALFFDEGAPADEYKSGYKLKDNIMEYYNNALDVIVLVHDAVTYYGGMDEYTLEQKLDAASQIIGTYANKANNVVMNYINTGELPKGYTPQELADLILDKILGVNGTIDNVYNKTEDYYMANEEKILEYIEKAKTFYEEYLDRDYTDIIDLANMSIYSGGDAYKIYQIILENGENAFDFDDAVTAIFDSPNYHGVSKIEDAMAKVEGKIKSYAYTPENNIYVYYRDAYKGNFESREIKGFETGTHTLALQRYFRYYK